MPLKNIKFLCPLCKTYQPIYQIWGNVTTFHQVDTIDDDGFAEMTEISEAEFRKSELDGFVCSKCFQFITYDLNNYIKEFPKLFTMEKED
jgi:hypothetical protein